MAERQHIVHPLPPIYEANARVLILGTMPSPKSREAAFYYAHPRNRFWPVLAAVFGEELPDTSDARIRFIHRHHIALWDVLAACDITGADDGSIDHPQSNDIGWLLGQAPIHTVFTTGQKAAQLYRRLVQPVIGRTAIELPSTSPANCGWTEQALIAAYAAVRGALEADQSSRGGEPVG